MKVVSSFTNFSRGQSDSDLSGRFDLPIYSSSCPIFENVISNFKGNAKCRQGFYRFLKHEECVLHRFKFNSTQNYLLVFTDSVLRFAAFDTNGVFGWVLDGMGDILEVVTPYSLTDAAELGLAQNFDVLYITHNSHAPRKLRRTASNAFTLLTYDINGSPFTQIVANITNVTQANPGVVTSTAHKLKTGDVVAIASVAGMTQLNGNTYTVDVLTADTFELRLTNTTGFTAYSSGGTATRSASNPALCAFHKGRLWYGRTATRTTTIWGSETGVYDNLDRPLTGLVDSDPLTLTLADLAQPIDWIYGGDSSLVCGSSDGIVAVNGGSVTTPLTATKVEATLTTADGASNVQPIRFDKYVFYTRSDKRRLIYFAYDILSEAFSGEDANIISYGITQSGIKRIDYKKDVDDLVYVLKENGELSSLNFNQKENIIGWHNHKTDGEFIDTIVISDNEGRDRLFALVLRNGEYYIEALTFYKEFSKRDSFFTGNKVADKEAFVRKTSEELKEIVYVDSALTFSDLSNVQITYASGVVTAASPSFVSGDVGKTITYKTETGYEYGKFLISDFISTTVVEVEVLQEPTQNVYSSWYLSINEITGLSDYNGQTISVIVNGAYLEDVEVSGGEIIINSSSADVVTIGFKYKSIIKTHSLGFVIQGENTQGTLKNIFRVGVRYEDSMGGFVGSDLYRMAEVQRVEDGALNYLPANLITGTKYVDYTDDSDFDKHFYFTQEIPAPFTITALMVDTRYGVIR